jgi:hypothetical protein
LPELPLSLEVWVVCVVVVVVVELVSGLVDWPDEVEDGDDDDWPDEGDDGEVDDGEVDDGEVDDGDVDCCELVSGVVDGDELLGEVCATAQTADNNRIAVIKDVFLMYVPPGFLGLRDSGLEKSGSSAKDLDHLSTHGFASLAIRKERNESCGIQTGDSASLGSKAVLVP